MKLNIDTKGIKEACKAVSSANTEINTIIKSRSFLSAVGVLLTGRAKQNMEDGATDGKSYDLKPKTKAYKLKKGYSAKPLQRTGLLRSSLNHSLNNGLKLCGLDILKHHQYGAPKANIPKREVYTIEKDDYTDIGDMITRRLKNTIR
ncbi:MAG: phage virion morphogenesis protein [Rikenellaceae bacterium]